MTDFLKHPHRRDPRMPPTHLAASPEWHSLNLAMQEQCQSNWCWLACAVSIALFYDQTTKWTQCSLANDQLGENDCCAGTCHSLDDDAACNQPGVVSSALTAVGHFEDSKPGALGFTALQAEIDAKRPVSLNLEWTGGGHHIVTIDGYQPGVAGAPDMISVKDPLHGPCLIAFADFPAHYNGGAKWIRTIRTQEIGV